MTGTWGCDTESRESRPPEISPKPIVASCHQWPTRVGNFGQVGCTIPIFPSFLSSPEYLQRFQEHLPAARGGGVVAGGDGRRAPRGRGLGRAARHLRLRQGLGLRAPGEREMCRIRPPPIPRPPLFGWKELTPALPAVVQEGQLGGGAGGGHGERCGRGCDDDTF